MRCVAIRPGVHLGRSPDELFAHFSPEPIATGSIAQVHQARLVDGTLAAVKIQRPRIRQIVSTDMDILYHLAQLLEKRYESARAVRVSMLAAEFEIVLEGELDFAAEAAHVNRFGRFFASDRQVRVTLRPAGYHATASFGKPSDPVRASRSGASGGCAR